MASLRSAGRLLLGASAVALGGCSLVLDADELKAELLDVSGADGETTGETSGETTTATDGVAEADAPGQDIVVDHSGPVSCELDYFIGITQCPETCVTGGWRYVVDASRSTGVGSFAWTFEATGGYRVTPEAAAGARVELRIEAPECIIGGTAMPDFTLLPRLATDGGALRLVELPQINVTQVTSCGQAEGCPAP